MKTMMKNTMMMIRMFEENRVQSLRDLIHQIHSNVLVMFWCNYLSLKDVERDW